MSKIKGIEKAGAFLRGILTIEADRLSLVPDVKSAVWLWSAVFCVFLFAGACAAPTDSVQAATPVPPSPTPLGTSTHVDPQAIFVQLTDTNSLKPASEQLADVLDARPGAVRVLFPIEVCAGCAQASGGGYGTELVELTMEEAGSRLKAGSSFWLNMPPIACLYTFDGKLLKPQGCRTQ